MHLMYAVRNNELQLVLDFPTNTSLYRDSPKKSKKFLNFTHTKMYTLLGF